MEIIRPSDRQLIFKAHDNMPKVLRDFAAMTPLWMVMAFLFVLISRIVFPLHEDRSITEAKAQEIRDFLGTNINSIK